MYLSIECSQTQFTANIISPKTGEITHQKVIDFDESMPHRNTKDGLIQGDNVGEYFVDPQMWVEALDLVMDQLASEPDINLAEVTAITGTAVHSIVYLKREFYDQLEALNPALPLNEQLRPHYFNRISPFLDKDSSAILNADTIKQQFNSPEGIRSITGIPLTSTTGAAHIHRLATHSDGSWNDVTHIHVTSSFLTSILTGKSSPIDETDTSQLCLYNIHNRCWDGALLDCVAPHLSEKLPLVTESPGVVIGKISDYFCHKYGFSPQAVCLSWLSVGAAYALGNGIVNHGDASFVLRDHYKYTISTKTIPEEIPSLAKVTIHPIHGYLAHMSLENGAQSFKQTIKRLGIEVEEINSQLEDMPNSTKLPTLPFVEPEKALHIEPSSQLSTTLLSFVTGQFLHFKLYSYWLQQEPHQILIAGEVASLKSIRQICANIFQVPVIHINDHNATSRGHAIIMDLENEVSRREIKEKYILELALSTTQPEPYMASVYRNQLNHYHHLLYDHINGKTEQFRI